MNISSAIFESSAPDLESCPDESLPEFAFIGRSNVGKSSLLNMLSGQRKLARVSPTPGFTKLINFFIMNNRWRLVDLPGYGFAQVARKDSARFNEAVTHYLQHRPNLCCVLALIDSSLPPQKIDLEFVEWMARNTVPFVLVFTKIDTSTPAKAAKNIKAFNDRISVWFEIPPETFSTSATTRHGRQELLDLIGKSLKVTGQEIPEESSSPTGEDLPDSVETPAPAREVKNRKPKSKRPNPARPW